MFAAPAGAIRSSEFSGFTHYVRAQAADAAGQPELAATQFAGALAADPGDVQLASRTYREAVVAGDRALAQRAIRILDAGGALPPDGLLMLLVDSFTSSDWKKASAIVARIDKDQAFSFLSPILRGWIALGSGDAEPWTKIIVSGGGSAAVYAAENKALMLLARGRADDGAEIIRKLATGSNVRDLHLRVMAAQALAAGGKRDAALGMLEGDEAALVAAAQSIRSAKRVAAPAIDPAFGLSELLIRVAVDVNRERVTPLSPVLARLATFASPGNPESWLAAAQLLAAADRHDAALSALAHMPTDGPLALSARITRIRILLARQANQDALDMMKAATSGPDVSISEWSLLGDIYNRMGQPAEAAVAYRKAIDQIDAKPGDADGPGTLWLLYGSALEQSGKWPEAKAALEKAAALSPDQAVVLNYLGYAQLERRENIPAARALIEKAYDLKPGDAAITDSLGWAFYLEGNLPAAIDKLEAAAEGDPGGSEINEHLGDAYWTAGRKIEARYAWAAALVTADKKASPRLSHKLDVGLEP